MFMVRNDFTLIWILWLVSILAGILDYAGNILYVVCSSDLILTFKNIVFLQSPGVMISIFIYTMIKFELPLYNSQHYPDGVYAFGWFLTALCLMQLPIFMIIAIYNQKESSFRKKLQGAFQPLTSWGPKNSLLKAQYDLLIGNDEKSSMV